MSSDSGQSDPNQSDLEDQIQQINVALANPPQSAQRQPSFVTRYACIEVQNQLNLLRLRDRHHFIVDKNKRPFFQNQSDSHIYQISRALKLRFKCKNNRCPHFKKQELEKKWTTYWGFVNFSFYFQKKEKGSTKTTPVLRINLKIYGQKCQKCREWGSGSIIKPDMGRLSRLYSIILQLIFIRKNLLKVKNLSSEVYLLKHQRKGKMPKKKNKKGTSHMSRLCEACFKGKCPLKQVNNDY